MAAQTVLEELARDELSREHVQRRVDDWSRRIEALYDQVERWLLDGWSARRGVPVQMQEELMRKLGVSQCELPTLELVHDGAVRAKFSPYGLWIIGTNGRIDLIKGRDRYLVLDHAGAFETAVWHVAPSTARRDSKPFSEEWLRALLTA